MTKTLDPETTDSDDVAEADAETILRTLSEELEAENMGVSVEKTPFGPKVGVETKTGKSSRFGSLEMRMSREFINRYEDLLVDLYELDADGGDLWWAIGEKMTEHGLDDVPYTWMGVFADPVGLTNRDFRFADYLHDALDSKAEMPEEFFDNPSKRDVRLWKEFRDTDNPDVEAVVAEAQNRFKAKYGYSDGTWVKKTQAVFEAIGGDVPDRDEVEAAIDALADE